MLFVLLLAAPLSSAFLWITRDESKPSGVCSGGNSCELQEEQLRREAVHRLCESGAFPAGNCLAAAGRVLDRGSESKTFIAIVNELCERRAFDGNECPLTVARLLDRHISPASRQLAFFHPPNIAGFKISTSPDIVFDEFKHLAPPGGKALACLFWDVEMHLFGCAPTKHFQFNDIDPGSYILSAYAIDQATKQKLTRITSVNLTVVGGNEAPLLVRQRLDPGILLVDHVRAAFNLADSNSSRLDHDMLDLEGFSGYTFRHFMNNLMNFKDCRYLEVGVFKGSTLFSALHGNSAAAVAIDQWAWTNLSTDSALDKFKENYAKHKGQNDITVIDSDCWTVTPESLPGKFNVYFYDANHEETSQRRAVTHFYEALAQAFVLVVDDWNDHAVRRGTYTGITEKGLKMLFHHEIFTDVRHVRDAGRERFTKWHNGIGVFVLTKS
jgi:hypothetical protein